MAANCETCVNTGFCGIPKEVETFVEKVKAYSDVFIRDSSDVVGWAVVRLELFETITKACCKCKTAEDD